MKFKKLIGKFKRVWKEEGLLAALGKSCRFIGDFEQRRERKKYAVQACKNKADILFISGCYVEHPVRYRVLHQMEQLELAGVSCQMVFFDNLELRMEQNYRTFLFFRCECTDEVAEFIDLAKNHGKTVLFDIDDLVTDTAYTDQVPWIQRLTPLNRAYFDCGVVRNGQTLVKSDIAVSTTKTLAEELGKVVSKTYINRNVASKEMVNCAEYAYQNFQKEETEKVWLGYFSGSLTHNNDFEMLRPVLEKLMDVYPQIGLILVGELDASDALNRFGDRIIKRKATSWKELPKLIVQADINLAPLEDTLFNRAKSEIKWIEAALVRVVTAASRVGAFEEMVEDGVTGILCGNTEAEWYEKLSALVENQKQRQQIAKNAYDYVMAHCTTTAKAEAFGDFVKEIIEK